MQALRNILHLLGTLLLILAGLLLIPMLFVLILNEPEQNYMTYLVPSLLSLLTGLSLHYGLEYKGKINLAQSMILCSLGWIVLSIFSGIPFMIQLNKSFLDSLFESVSGLTTTGITVFQGLDAMPDSILFWRSLIQWVGGLGILTFFLFVTTSSEGEIWQLFSAEGHKIDAARPYPNVFRTVKVFWIIYAAYTAVEMVILKLLGLSWIDAIFHSLTTLSTGGFSNHDASVGYYASQGFANAALIEYTFIFFMFLGGINFLVHFKIFKQSPLKLFQDIEAKAYMKIIISFTGISFIMMIVNNTMGGALEEGFRKLLFQIVSLITSTGFGTEDIGSPLFPAITKQLFVILMVVGGCVGSTAGGFKVIRIVILNKLFRREVKRTMLPPSAQLPITVDHAIISPGEIKRIAGLLYGWLILLLLGAGITAIFSTLGPWESLSGMASALGNMGPFYFSVGEMAAHHPIIKVTYIIGMLAGRLEILPLVVLFQRRAWKS